MDMDNPSNIIDPAMVVDLWTEHTSFVDENSPVTCIEYDNCFDLSWIAHANGRLTSFVFSDEMQYLEDQIEETMFVPPPPAMTRFSSFPATQDAITQLLPNHSTILSIGCSKIRMHTHGGAGLSSWWIDHCPNPIVLPGGGMTMLSSHDSAFTCADLIRDPTVSRTSSGFVATSMVAGTSGPGAYLFDLTQTVDSPIMCYNVVQPTVRIHSNGHLIAVAGQDGE